MHKKTIPLLIASDHAGFPLKEYLVKVFQEKGYSFKDFGTDSESTMDYPDVIHPLASEMENGKFPFGVIMCGSGIGVSIVANKYPWVRAALCWDEEQAELTRMHNNANVLAFPGRYIDFDKAVKMLEIFLNTEFEGGRHQRRVEKIPR
mgnify:CR=1 FL=1